MTIPVRKLVFVSFLILQRPQLSGVWLKSTFQTSQYPLVFCIQHSSYLEHIKVPKISPIRLGENQSSYKRGWVWVAGWKTAPQIRRNVAWRQIMFYHKTFYQENGESTKHLLTSVRFWGCDWYLCLQIGKEDKTDSKGCLPFWIICKSYKIMVSEMYRKNVPIFHLPLALIIKLFLALKILIFV